MLSIENQYLDLLLDVMAYGKRKDLHGATEENSHILSLFARMIRHSFQKGFPIYSTKKVFWSKAIAEMLWFLNPKDNSQTLDVADLQTMGANIWDDWIPESGNTAIPVHYGNQTNWAGTGLDQTAWVIEGLLTKPHRKSYIVNSWDPSTVYAMAEQSGKPSVVLPACHYSYQLVSNGPQQLSMMVNIRSNDLMLGNPFNLVQYAALLEMYCHVLSNRSFKQWAPDELVISIGDAHIYSSQMGAVREQLSRRQNTYGPVELLIEQRGQQRLQDFQLSDFSLQGYKPEGYIKGGTLFAAGGY